MAGASPVARSAAAPHVSELLREASSTGSGVVPSTASEESAFTSASDDDGNQFVLWKGDGGSLWSAVYSAALGTWTSAAIAVPGAGTLGSEPSALVVTVSGTEYLYVFWQGSDGNLWYDYGVVTPGTATSAASVGSWSGPTSIGGLAPLDSQPAVTYVTSGSQAGIDVFWKGSDGDLWSAVLAGAGGALSLSNGPSAHDVGPLGSAPTAGSDGSGNVYVYWQGPGGDTAIYESYYDAASSSWSGEIDLGLWTGDSASAPSVAVDRVGDQYLFWQGENGSLYYAYWDGTQWSGWVGVGYSPMGSAPAATVTLAGSQATMSGFTVVWEGSDENMWYATYDFDTDTWSIPNYEPYGPIAS